MSTMKLEEKKADLEDSIDGLWFQSSLEEHCWSSTFRLLFSRAGACTVSGRFSPFFGNIFVTKKPFFFFLNTFQLCLHTFCNAWEGFEATILRFPWPLFRWWQLPHEKARSTLDPRYSHRYLGLLDAASILNAWSLLDYKLGFCILKYVA